jgi:hypothetical protein
MRVESRCSADCPCLSFVISSSSMTPTIISVMTAASKPPAIVAMTVATRPPIIRPVPRVPRPAMPADAGCRQLP